MAQMASHRIPPKTSQHGGRSAFAAPAAAPQQHNLHRDNRRRDARGEDHGGSAVDLTDSMQSQRGTSAEDCVGRGRSERRATRVRVGVHAEVSACCFNFYLVVSAPLRRVRGSVRSHARCDASRTCSRARAHRDVKIGWTRRVVRVGKDLRPPSAMSGACFHAETRLRLQSKRTEAGGGEAELGLRAAFLSVGSKHLLASRLLSWCAHSALAKCGPSAMIRLAMAAARSLA